MAQTRMVATGNTVSRHRHHLTNNVIDGDTIPDRPVLDQNVRRRKPNIILVLSAGAALSVASLLMELKLRHAPISGAPQSPVASASLTGGETQKNIIAKIKTTLAPTPAMRPATIESPVSLSEQSVLKPLLDTENQEQRKPRLSYIFNDMDLAAHFPESEHAAIEAFREAILETDPQAETHLKGTPTLRRMFDDLERYSQATPEQSELRRRAALVMSAMNGNEEHRGDVLKMREGDLIALHRHGDTTEEERTKIARELQRICIGLSAYGLSIDEGTMLLMEGQKIPKVSRTLVGGNVFMSCRKELKEGIAKVAQKLGFPPYVIEMALQVYDARARFAQQNQTNSTMATEIAQGDPGIAPVSATESAVRLSE
jgi:hypothetical protein